MFIFKGGGLAQLALIVTPLSRATLPPSRHPRTNDLSPRMTHSLCLLDLLNLAARPWSFYEGPSIAIVAQLPYHWKPVEANPSMNAQLLSLFVHRQRNHQVQLSVEQQSYPIRIKDHLPWPHRRFRVHGILHLSVSLSRRSETVITLQSRRSTVRRVTTCLSHSSSYLYISNREDPPERRR